MNTSTISGRVHEANAKLIYLKYHIVVKETQQWSGSVNQTLNMASIPKNCL